jgi:ABC-type branched-subunit amino acid transport system substrate-binding protein
VAAAKVVNDSGGVLGHQLRCQAVNDTGDPADAVPAANRMLTSISNLVSLVGPGGVSPAVVPIFTAAHIPMFSIAGNPQYDLNTDPWYYRLVPSDSVTGRVMAYWGSTHVGNVPAASVFTSVSAQTVPAPLAAEYQKLGGHIVKSVILAPGQSSYRTEAEQVLAAHPKVIFTETDPQTAATFFSELLQLSGSLPPVIGDEADTYSPWVKAVLPVVSHKLSLVAVTQTAPGSSPGYLQFKNALLASGAVVKNPAQYSTGPFTIADYDGVIITALAINAAHSTDPLKFRPYITSVTGLVQSGDTVVHTYTEGVAALKSGKTIRYSGAGGQISFNAHHNAATPFGGLKLNAATGTFTSVGNIPLQTLLRIQ